MIKTQKLTRAAPKLLGLAFTLAATSWASDYNNPNTGISRTQPSSVNESAPARTGKATVPTGGGNQLPAQTGARYPGSAIPSNVSESAPARTGRASTPTGGAGQSAPPPNTEAMNRLPRTPSSVNESAPARTGRATVPTGQVQSFETADLNRNGVIDRSEYDALFGARGATR